MVTVQEMQKLEQAAFARGVDAGELMEKAGRGIAEVVRQFHPRWGTCIAFCGKGNNAGDALVALRYLAEEGWHIAVDLAYGPNDLGPLPKKHLESIADQLTERLSGPVVILDGLLGLGAKGEPRGPVAGAIQRLNTMREKRGAWVLAIDLPSGLDGDSGQPAGVCVKADLTATICVGKTGLVADAAINAVGRLAVIPLPELLPPPAQWLPATSRTMRGWLPERDFDTHKGVAGRIGIVAGSHGLTGAARLASAAAVKGGGGLVTLYAKPDIYPILAASCIPEVMVKEVEGYRELTGEKVDVWAVGPGLGAAGGQEILSLVRDAEQPMIVDADALNAVARDVALLKHVRGPRLLTPHPGEMERLFPQDGRSRREWLEAFLAEYPVTLLLKGARTLLGAEPKGERFLNTTGNPGMASGGMGDVLTGVTAALAAQLRHREKGSLLRAGTLGAWICGRAAELAVFSEEDSPESLSATEVLGNLGRAFGDLRSGVF